MMGGAALKISNLKNKLAFCAVYVGVIALWMALDLQCFWLATFGVPCPGCGMTRATLAALRLDFAEAFRLHPMFWVMPALGVHLFLDGGLFRRRWANVFFLCALAAGFLLSWLRHFL